MMSPEELRRLWGLPIEWKPPRGKNLASLWNECPDGRWLARCAERTGVSARASTGAAIACARSVLPFDPESEPSWRLLLARASRFVDGTLALDELESTPAPARFPAEQREEAATTHQLAVTSWVGALRGGGDPSLALGQLAVAILATAALRGMDARRAAREETVASVEAFEREGRLSTLGAAIVVPPSSSPAFDHAARGVADALLLRAADAIRAAIPNPFE